MMKTVKVFKNRFFEKRLFSRMQARSRYCQAINNSLIYLRGYIFSWISLNQNPWQLFLSVLFICLTFASFLLLPAQTQAQIDKSRTIVRPFSKETPKETPPKETPREETRQIRKRQACWFAFGDSGSGTPQQYMIAKALANRYRKIPCPLVLMLGDNIYPDGNVQLYGQSRFTKPYSPLLSQGVRFLPVLGNHDIKGGFTKEGVTFFKMPDTHYTFKQGPVEFFALDTNQFDKTQEQWLQQQLAKSVSRWKVVYGHHPVLSSGTHGPTPVLLKTLKPILEKYHVDLYLSGHDHDYERFQPVQGVFYVVSGGGGASLRQIEKISPGSQVRLSKHHFLYFELIEFNLYFWAFGTQGEVLDQGVLQKVPSTPSRAKALENHATRN